MIVPMKRLFLLCVSADAERTLGSLRDLGAVHLDRTAEVGTGCAAAMLALERAERAVRIVEKAAKGRECVAASVAPLDSADAVLALDAKRETLEGEAGALKAAVRRYAPFGDFDPALAKQLEAAGVKLFLRDDGSFEFLYGDATPEDRPGTHPVPLPEERLGALQERLAETERQIAALTDELASANLAAIRETFPGLREDVAFAAARDEMAANRVNVDEADAHAPTPLLALVRGWIPADGVEALGAAAKANGWGIALRDPLEGETPPTLIRPPKVFRPVLALFEGLGIAPAYTESDVSVPFLCYFALFTAMLVGDGGYGALVLALTLLGWRKYRKGAAGPSAARTLMKSWLVLLTVFSSATIVWGTLSNTWFGAGLPFAAEWPTVKWLGDPTYNNMMFLCFTIGVSHLVLARLWNGICMASSAACLPEFGWAGILVFMYFVVNAIVGISSGVPAWSYWLFGASLALVIAKTRGVALGMLPLNVMSAMGDIISYVRLFAVGYASLQVAQNFNRMALELDLPTWGKIVPMVCILLIGHGINFVLAGLSVLVHAVRLNTLEFSNHKGLTWSGYAFSPFKKH